MRVLNDPSWVVGDVSSLTHTGFITTGMYANAELRVTSLHPIPNLDLCPSGRGPQLLHRQPLPAGAQHLTHTVTLVELFNFSELPFLLL